MSMKTNLDCVRELGLNPLAAVVSSVSELYQMPEEALNRLKTQLISDSFRFHYENNSYYRAACESKGIRPSDIQRFEDLIRIPLVPIAKFKSPSSHELLSKPLNTIEHEMRSTGTSGLPSISRRCSDTVDTAVVAIYAMYREFLGISKGAGLYVCPSTEEIPEMGMIKALNMLAGLLDTHRFMVKQERFVPEDALAQLQSWENKFTRHIIGPPFLIHRLLQFLQQTGRRIKLDKGSMVITLGGWKRFTGQMISRREFNLMCEEYLGLAPNGVRDIYALVESNVMAIDDEHQIKHVSPYVHFTVRDMNDLSREVPDGEKGVLGILDPLALATPGMILTEDIVSLVPGASPSGRSGQRMEYIMRAPSSLEFGCCAVNLEKKMDGTEAEEAACPVVN
ncbi:MAG: LuxE family acyl-protein synthetase [Rubrivivax sp.]|jgi:phenylacetate-coenzyme A ligase PaaK-like adenylate-forming protein|nr:LuxE family acyl-protein synthetase [Rubrivivax sp.]